MNNNLLIKTLVVAATFGISFQGIAKREKKQNKFTVAGTELLGGDFELTNHLGQRVSNKTYAGKYLLVFFGFTHCPSACPIGMHTMVSVLKELGSVSSEFQPLFISVDPERDSAAILSEFVKRYDSRIVGLRGTLEETERVVTQYHAYFQKTPAIGGDKKNYLMDHSTLIYFMDKKGKYISHYESSEGSQKIAKSIQDRMSLLPPQN
jgi:protein SCO1/2